MAKKVATKETVVASRLKSSSLLDIRVVSCGDNLEQLAKLPDACDFAFRTPHSAIAVTGSFYYHCDWHASHCIKVMPGRSSDENNFECGTASKPQG